MNGFVIGWAMSERMTTPLICDALQMALWQRKHPKGVIVHSDRGSQTIILMDALEGRSAVFFICS